MAGVAASAAIFDTVHMPLADGPGVAAIVAVATAAIGNGDRITGMAR